MTIIMIESESEATTALFMKIAEEQGVSATKHEHRVLTDEDAAFGIGRKATSKELIEYMSLDDEEPVDLSAAFAKYSK